MTSTVEWTMSIPSEPTPRLVVVSNISNKTEQVTLEDFFSFCGVIEGFEMKNNNDKHIALILFEQESSAKTATLLSQAEIDELPIQVEYYFKQQQQETVTEKGQVVEPVVATTEKKSASRVMSELLASGYILTENVIAKGVDFDERHGGRLNGYYSKMSEQFSQLQQKIKGNKKNDSSSRASIKLHDYASRVANKVSQVHKDAKRIAAEKQQ